MLSRYTFGSEHRPPGSSAYDIERFADKSRKPFVVVRKPSGYVLHSTDMLGQVSLVPIGPTYRIRAPAAFHEADQGETYVSLYASR